MMKYEYDVKKFKSKKEAKEYCLSKECSDYIDYLFGLYDTLSELSKTETKCSIVQGLRQETYSSHKAAYVMNEAERLRNLRDYFNNKPPKKYYIWEYSTHGNHSVEIKVDLSKLSNNHPLFIDYCVKHKIHKNRLDEAYDIFIKLQRDDLTLNELFKYNYYWVDFIPDSVKLLRKDK